MKILQFTKKHTINILGIAFLVVTTQSQAQNLIINPSFEDSLRNWQQIEPVEHSGHNRTGNNSAKLSNEGAKVSQRVFVIPNTNYTLSAYVKGFANIGIELNQGIKKDKISQASSAWQKVSIEFNSETSDSVLVYANYYLDLGRIDDFSLSESNSVGISKSFSQDPIDPVCLPTLLPILNATDDGKNDGNIPSNTIDGNLNNRWSSKGSGRYLTLDIGQMAEPLSLEIKWYKGDERVYIFTVETSVDGNNWLSSLIKTSSSSISGFEAHNIENIFNPEIRFVRIIGEGNTKNQWTAIAEARITGCI